MKLSMRIGKIMHLANAHFQPKPRIRFIRSKLGFKYSAVKPEKRQEENTLPDASLLGMTLL